MQVCDSLHEFELVEDRILEALKKQVVLGLLDLVGVFGFHLRPLELIKERFSTALVKLLANGPIRLLSLDLGVNLDFLCGSLTLEPVHEQLDVVGFLAQLLLMRPLQLFLFKIALMLELLVLQPSRLEIHLLVRLLLHLLHVQVPLRRLEFLVELLEVDGVLGDQALERSLLVLFLPELGLHIFEKA